MNIFKQAKKFVERDILISLLTKAENKEILSQKKFASNIGIAVGLVNLYIKKCIKKGWIKITNVPNKRYVYYLTPKGFEEKSRLVCQYLKDSFNFLESSKKDFLQLFEIIKKKFKKIAIVGNGELVEVALIVAQASDTKIDIIYSDSIKRKEILEVPVTNSISKLIEMDIIIFAEYNDAQRLNNLLQKKITNKKFLYPSFLSSLKKN
tara:strand:+ start:2266 stop:2886 length:621 start_codon:yes stop_codon:yes gene_type:complete